MIRKSLLLVGVLGLGLVSLSNQAKASLTESSSSETYWCVFTCVDGTQGGGSVTATQTQSGGTLCNQFAAQQCSRHGGVSILGLDPYTLPTSGSGTGI
jgi:hypothetical protein